MFSYIFQDKYDLLGKIVPLSNAPYFGQRSRQKWSPFLDLCKEQFWLLSTRKWPPATWKGCKPSGDSLLNISLSPPWKYKHVPTDNDCSRVKDEIPDLPQDHLQELTIANHPISILIHFAWQKNHLRFFYLWSLLPGEEDLRNWHTSIEIEQLGLYPLPDEVQNLRSAANKTMNPHHLHRFVEAVRIVKCYIPKLFCLALARINLGCKTKLLGHN